MTGTAGSFSTNYIVMTDMGGRPKEVRGMTPKREEKLCSKFLLFPAKGYLIAHCSFAGWADLKA